MGPIYNNSALGHVMDGHRRGNKRLTESMMNRLNDIGLHNELKT